jgi:hypothetical protein
MQIDDVMKLRKDLDELLAAESNEQDIARADQDAKVES